MKTTYEITKEIIEKGNVKEIFDIISLSKVSEVSLTITDFCKDCSTSFVSDICSKRDNTQMSVKQLWCVSYEVLKIKHMYDSWVEKMIDSIKDLEDEGELENLR
jgi:hypothetical protein